MTLQYGERPNVTHEQLVDLVGDRDWDTVLAQSLTWIGAIDDSHQLVGFVNVAWDGGAHAFLLDPTVHPERRREGIGSALVGRATAAAAAAGCEWLHVDFTEDLAPFYERCGFRSTRAGLMPLAPADLVRRGYDEMGKAYLEFTRAHMPTRVRWLEKVQECLEDGSRVLDLGCGAGEPATRLLSERHDVVGVDLSMKQLLLARRYAPMAMLVQADMARLAFPAGSFDAVVSMWAFLHVPRDQQMAVVDRIFDWLGPGGALLVSLGVRDDAGTVEDFLGGPMYFSHFDSDAMARHIAAVGFEIDDQELVHEEDGDLALWLLARRP